MDRDRINFKVFIWSLNLHANKKNWCYKVKDKLRECNFGNFINIDCVLSKRSIVNLEDIIFDRYKSEWNDRILTLDASKKLRTYKLFKNIYKTEKYLMNNINYRYRSAFAKFRCGVTPLRIETGRYEGKNIEERKCFYCNSSSIEDEKHVLLYCPLYADLRVKLFQEINNYNVEFSSLSDDQKFIYLFKADDCFYNVAKTCCNILSRRNTFLFS